MIFLNIHILWHLIWVMPLLVLIFSYAAARRRNDLKKILGPRASDPSFVNLSSARRFLRFLILIGALICLFLAAARPSWGHQIMPFQGKGRDILFVLDVSRSMLSKDVQPSRLEHAKWLIRKIVENSPGNRFGLVSFAGSAFLECPLTSDRSSFFQILADMNTDSIPLGGTNIQAALETAEGAFQAAETGHRAVILVTDGDELQGRSASVIDRFKSDGIPIFVAGIGDPNQPGLIPVVSEDKSGSSFLRDASGELVKSALNEKQLSALAIETNGIYVRSTTANPGLTEILNKIKSLVPVDYDSGKQKRAIERFIYPLIAAFILLLVWLLISERRSIAVSRSILLLLGLGTMSFNVSAQNSDQTSLPLPSPSASAKLPEKKLPAAENKNPVVLYNNALEVQKKNDLKSARTMYEDAVNKSSNYPMVRTNSFQNLGVIQHQDARKIASEASELLKKQDLDAAIAKLDSSLQEMRKAEELYVESMTPGTTVSDDQQILLRDRAEAQKLKKMIEELKKQQQKAQQQAQKAMDQQKKENQQKNDKKENNKQDKKQQQKNNDAQKNKNSENKDKNTSENKQDQNKPDSENQQNEQEKPQPQSGDSPAEQKSTGSNTAHQNTESARKAAGDLKNKAAELGQNGIEKSAEAAEKELEKAMESQDNKNGKAAEKYIQKAIDELGAGNQKNDKNNDKNNKEQKNKDQQDNNKSDKDNSQKDDKNNQNNKQPLPKKTASGQKSSSSDTPDKNIDPAQAEALLDLMAGEEKNLRDAIKERNREASSLKEVDKNW